jgi:hypothetical protein
VTEPRLTLYGSALEILRSSFQERQAEFFCARAAEPVHFRKKGNASVTNTRKGQILASAPTLLGRNERATVDAKRPNRAWVAELA